MPTTVPSNVSDIYAPLKVVVRYSPPVLTILVEGISTTSSSLFPPSSEAPSFSPDSAAGAPVFPDTDGLFPDTVSALTPTTGAMTRLRARAAVNTFFTNLLLIIADSSLLLKHLFFIFNRQQLPKEYL